MALSLERLLQNAHDLGFEYEETCISDTNPIRQLKQLHSCRSEIEKLSTEIEQRKWFLQNPKPSVYSQLESMNGYIGTLLEHLQRVLLHKDVLTSYLQHPFTGDYIVVEREYQRDFRDLLLKIASIMNKLQQILDAFKWMATLNVEDSQLEKRLSVMSSTLAKCQMYSDTLQELDEWLSQYKNRVSRTKVIDTSPVL